MARAQRSASLKATLRAALGKFVAILHLVNGAVILKAVGPGLANDPDERSRSINSPETLGQLILAEER